MRKVETVTTFPYRADVLQDHPTTSLLHSCSRSMRCFLFVTLCLLATCFTPNNAQAKNELRIARTIELPDMGLSMKIMANSTETPLPASTATTITSPDKKETIDVYRAYDFWFETQFAGRWADPYGNSVMLGTMTSLIHDGFMENSLTRSEYEKKTDIITQQPTEWTQDLLERWAAAYSEVESAEAELVQRRPSNLRDLYSFALKDRPRALAYAFRLNQTTAGQPKTSPWLFVMFDIDEEADLDKAKTTILAEYFPNVTFVKMETRVVGPSKSFQKRGNEKLVRSPEFIASRDQVVKSIKNMKDWWFVETENYILLSDLDTKDRHFIKELQTHIERLRSAYEQLIPPKQEIKGISVVRVFGDEREYEDYVPADCEWSAGVWLADQRELVIRPVDWGNVWTRENIMQKIIAHEAFHQYAYYALDRIHTSSWFNEGHAEFLEDSEVDGSRVTIKENTWKTKIVERAVVSGQCNLKELLDMSSTDFYAKQKEIRSRNYALAWALIFYLRKEAEFSSKSPYAGILNKYIEALLETKNADKATDKAFEDIDMKAFQRDFDKFWQSPSKRARAARNKTKAEGKEKQ